MIVMIAIGPAIKRKKFAIATSTLMSPVVLSVLQKNIAR